MQINILHLAEVRSGGWVTNTAHLTRSLQQCGHEATIFKIRAKTEKKSRPYGYGVEYWAVTEDDAVKIPKRGPTIINITSPPYHQITFDLMKRGAFLVIHDPTEIQDEAFRNAISKYPILVNRKRMAEYFDDAHWLPHSYVRATGTSPAIWSKRPRLGVSLSRIDFDKNTDWILAANESLPKLAKVDLFGDEHRPYSRFLMECWPDWVQTNGIRYPREPEAAVQKATSYRFNVDMSSIKGDGGGTQWSFLEGIDAGCITLINSAWVAEKGQRSLLSEEKGKENQQWKEMRPGKNCLAVGSAEELTLFLTEAWKRRNDAKFASEMGRIHLGALCLLEDHAPEKVVPMLMTFLKKHRAK